MPAAALTPFDRIQTVAAKALLALPPKTQRLLSLVVRANFAHYAAAFTARPEPVAWTRELRVAGAEGSLGARLYVPHGYRAPGALLVFFHGGGWVVGDIDTHDGACRFIARHSGCAVISVDYRLAPEHPFPAPVDDALAAFADICERAGELGADPKRIGVGGDSAGGHLAAVVAQQTVSGEGASPAFQLLIYPVIDNSGEPWRSRELFAEGRLLERTGMDSFTDSFLPPRVDRDDPRVSPRKAADASGGAPAYVVTAGFDPLCDEGEAYAARLKDAGVCVTLRRQAGLVHGFIALTGISSSAARATAEIAGALQVGLAEQ